MRKYLCMITAAVSLATIGIFVKLIGDHIHFMTLIFYRFFFGLLFLLMVVPFIDKNLFKITKKDAGEYFLVGIVLVISISFFTIAFKFAPVQNVVLLHYTSPFFVLILGYWFLKEKITRTKIILLAIAIPAICIINPLNMGPYLLGNIIALLSAIAIAIYIVTIRKIDMEHSIGDVVWFLFFGTLILLPAPFIFGFGNVSAVLPYIIGIGFFSTGLAHLMYNLALERMEAETASIITLIVSPLVAIVLALLILNEEIGYRVLIGGSILIISGIYMQVHMKKEK